MTPMTAYADPSTIDLARLDRAVLERMLYWGGVAADSQQRLARERRTMLDEALGGAAPIEEWRHYPEGDVYDSASHAQYFYHRHLRGDGDSGHGHFHTFLRARGIPLGLRPLVMPELAIAGTPAAPEAPVPSAPQSQPGEESDPWTHLVAIEIDHSGRAIRLFATNRWVTGETWFAAADVALMLDAFAVGSASPSRVLNDWISGLVGLFRPQIVALLHARDAAVMGWRRRRRGKVHVLEDRRLEVAASCDIDLEAQLRGVEAALRAASPSRASATARSRR
jgi:hypothetical protein